MRKYIKTIFLVDGNALVIQTYKLILSSNPGFQVTDVFSNAEDAIRKMKKVRPDVIISELELPGMSGIDFVRWCRINSPSADFVFLSSVVKPAEILEALRAGAVGYLTKNMSHLDFMKSIGELLKDGAPLTVSASRAVVESFHVKDPAGILGRREVEVMTFLSRGMTYKEIGDALSISPETVKSHLRNIYKKLDVTKKSEALAKAKQLRLIG